MSGWELIWLVIPAIVLIAIVYRSRGLRIVVVALVGIGLFFVPSIMQAFDEASSSGSSGETSVIQNYDADFTIGADGSLQLVETLDVKFNQVRRGIFRFFDETDAQDSSVKHPVEVVSIKRCPEGGGEARCVNEPYEEYYEGEYLVAKIGSASVPYPPGTVNRYIITSKQNGVLTTVTDSADVQWYWDVVGAGWQMPMRKVRVEATFPAEPTDVRCITDSGACPVSPTDGARNYVTELNQLPPMTPVTWKALLPAAGLTAVSLDTATPWWQTFMAPVVGVLAALVLFALIWQLHDPKPSEAPVFAAPGNDILPAVWTWREQAPDDPFQSVLMQLNHFGAVKLTVDPASAMSDRKPDWVEVQRTTNPLPAEVTGSQDLLNKLGIAAPGATEVIDKDSVTLGKKIQGLEASLARASGKEALARGWYTHSASGKLVNLVSAALPVIAGLVLIWTRSPFFAAMFLIPGIAGLWSTRQIGTRLTPAGRQMRDQVSGLRTALSTPASVERFDYALKARYFAQFLPWAVALGCADKWAEACKPPPGVEMDTASPYYPAYMTYHASQAISTAVTSVAAGAVASYAATQSSSSGGGGGGGFSSGGGSGGGGGGSW